MKEIQHLPGENQKLAHKLKDCEDLLDDLGNDRDRAEKAKKKAHKDNEEKDDIIKDLEHKLENAKKKAHKDNGDKDDIIRDLEHKLNDKCKENEELIQILRETEPKV